MREPVSSATQHQQGSAVSTTPTSPRPRSAAPWCRRGKPVAFLGVFVMIAVILSGCDAVNGAAPATNTSSARNSTISAANSPTQDYNNAGALGCSRGIPLYLRAITQDPSYTNAYVGLGGCYATLGDFTEAIAEYNKAIAMDPTQFGLYRLRAASEYSKGNSGSALTDLKVALQYAPPQAPTYVTIAQDFDSYQDFTDAIATVTKAIDLAPNNPTFYETRAQMYLHAQQSRQAYDDYRQAITIAPSEAYKSSIYVAFANVYLQQQNIDAALQSIQHAINLQPNDPHLYVTSGDIHQQVGRLGEVGRHDGALGLYQHALSLTRRGPNALAAYEGEGNVLVQLGQNKMAIAAYQSAKKLTKDPGTLTRLAGEIKAARAGQ